MSDADGRSPIGERVLAGTLWVGAWRWSARLIGLATTIVVARILLPDDFGVFATGLIVVSLFDVLFDLGTDMYLIRHADPAREDYDTAWTLRLLLALVAAAAITLGAPLAADFFDDTRLIDVFRVLALASLLRGFVNIGLTKYRRDLRYDRIAAIGITQRIVGSATTVLLAVLLESYWALVLGEIALRVAELVLSYVAHPFRPRVRFVRFGTQWHFSKWVVVRNLATFLQARGDQIVVARFLGIEHIGVYSMAMRCAMIPTSQLTAPMRNPIYSGLARKQDEPVAFERSVSRLFGTLCVVMFPAAAFFVVMGEDVLLLVLGPNWRAAGPLVAPLVCAATLGVLTQPAGAVLTVTGRVRLVAALGWGAALATVAVMAAVALSGSLQTLAVARAAVSAAVLAAYLTGTVVAVGLSWRSVAAGSYRPALAAVAAALAATATATCGLGPTAAIAAGLAAAAAAYAVVLYALWRAAGAPDSAEAMLLRSAVRLSTRRRRGANAAP